jgi:Transposase zinc-binding domain
VTPPALEIADLIRTAGAAFVERNCQWIRWRHVKVLRAIARCRTAALGGHLDECTRCAHRAPISYNSCLMESFFNWRVRSARCHVLTGQMGYSMVC